ncbi:MAG: YggS family pyridoxal phosphate-dependent enzyme [Deferribacteraceae bacterium]|jgi:pyridoxal phosphate enzyme (YggS family)|nr:YggS family pyridoxal phosphate-dependent enzyme [Deferribacteraceae bacterium]
MLVDNYHATLADIAETAIKAGRKPEDIALLAVSKTYPVEDIATLYQAGCLHFGESRVQEASEKMLNLHMLPKIDHTILTGQRFDTLTFDLIGRLQTNKAKQVIGSRKYRLVHSVDRPELVIALEQAAAKAGHMQQDILLQLSLAGEPQKGGVTEAELPALYDAVMQAEHLRLCGFMTIPPFDDDAEVARPYFRRARELFDKYSTQNPAMTVLSMGMSDDYKVAIEEGATMLRIGTAIFGARE